MKAICASYGFDAVAPMDLVDNEAAADPENPYQTAAQLFHRYQQHVRDCDIILADLNDFRGYEPSNDVSFECGMGYQLGKNCLVICGTPLPCGSASLTTASRGSTGMSADAMQKTSIIPSI